MSAQSEFRDQVLARLDTASFFAAQGITLERLNAKESKFLCPIHGEREASANVNIETGLWFCHVCNLGGSPIDMLLETNKSLNFRGALEQLAKTVGLDMPAKHTNGAAAAPTTVTKGKLTEANIKMWAGTAKRADWLMTWLTEKRGYTDETIERFQLGWDGSRVTLPIRDAEGKLVNVRRRRDPRIADDGAAGKVIGLAAGMNEARLWPLDALAEPEVVLLEGEWDTMLMHQYGFANALTVTSGAGIFNSEWVSLFEGKMVTIIYDNDEAGRKGELLVAAKLARVTTVFLVHIPNLPDKGDVTDFFVEQGRSADELRTLIADATPYLKAPVATDEPAAIPVHLYEASDAKNRGKRLSLPVLLSGKATTPYTVPFKYKASCDMSNKKFCAVCPLQETGGVKDVVLSAKDPAVLSLVNVTTAQQLTALKALSGAVPQCNRPLIEVDQSINVEELRLIPELDTKVNQDSGDTEYVTRTGYFLGHGLRPNRGYEMIGYSHPHPKTQATVHLLSEAIPAQDNISAFAMTPELHDSMKIFQASPNVPGGDVKGRFRDIYDDFALTVHRIQDRHDMQVAYDLLWHSAISFYFNGAFVRRGWVEMMVMGDSGQGKTEMAMNLLSHYRLGQRVQGENTSGAGLIGGLEKMGDSWMLSWGQIPLNDKRLVIIDETQGIAPAQIEGMSDVRATGVAEITKIRTEKTNARCRIGWLANPVSGLTLSQHNQGVLAVKDLFKKPEDIRRLDLAITVASGDVRLEQVNVRHDEAATEPRYSAEASRTLVLWAWSRRPDQISFSREAVDLILEEATRMGRRYHPSIPLVEPSDQRLKLARLATAAAARTFATDDGERLLVTDAHVRFVVDFLDRIYNSPSMAYGEYSDQQRKGEALTPNEAADVKIEVDRWTNREGAIEFFRSSRIFKRTDLSDVVGWDAEEAKTSLRYLSSRRLIRPTREGFVKTPAFIVLLRDVAGPLTEGSELEGLPEGGDF